MKLLNRCWLFVWMALLTACGGGGGGGCGAQLAFGGAANCQPDPTPVSDISTYTAAAMPGELLTVGWNPSTLSLTYSITGSLFNLSSQERQLPMQFNAIDKTFSTSAYSGKFGFNASGLMYGTIHERFYSSVSRAPVFGLQSLSQDASQRLDIFNVVGTTCQPLATCVPYYGTFRFNADGSWDWCQDGNLFDQTSTCTASENGRVEMIANTGRMNLKLASLNTVGTAMLSVINDQKVLLIDWSGATSSFDGGMAIGAAQSNAPTAVDGVWRFASTTETGRLVINGTRMTPYIDGQSAGTAESVVLNSPWRGIAKSQTSLDYLLMAQSGVFVSAGPSGFRVGLKYE